MGCTLTTEEVAHIDRTIAKLREQLEYDRQTSRSRAELIDRLKAENAKLRELVRVFYHCTTSGECDECPANGGGTVKLMADTICDTLHDRMREMGVVE